jgi:cytochrome c oxidase subunit 3
MNHSETGTAVAKDAHGIKFGMWLFLYSEIMLFAGLFVLYAAYFDKYMTDFINAGKELNLIFGSANTLILLTSSFTVAASITATRQTNIRMTYRFLWASVLLGVLFLVNKYFEWGAKFAHDIYPGSETLTSGPQGEGLFFSLYYVITGLHGVHIIVGLSLLVASIFLLQRGKIGPKDYVFLENAGLYWHLVDLIWIFIFPLFYLVL